MSKETKPHADTKRIDALAKFVAKEGGLVLHNGSRQEIGPFAGLQFDSPGMRRSLRDALDTLRDGACDPRPRRRTKADRLEGILKDLCDAPASDPGRNDAHARFPSRQGDSVRRRLSGWSDDQILHAPHQVAMAATFASARRPTPRGRIQRWYRARRMQPRSKPAGPWVYVSVLGLASEARYEARVTLRFALGNQTPNGLIQWGGPWQFERLDGGSQVELFEMKSGNGATVWMEKF